MRKIKCGFCGKEYDVPYGFEIPMHEGKVECYPCNLKRVPHSKTCTCIFCKFFGHRASDS